MNLKQHITKAKQIVLFVAILFSCNYASAIELSDTIKSNINALGSSEEKIDLLLEYSYQLKKIDTVQAMECSRKAVEIANEINSDKYKIETLQFRGIQYSDYDQYDSAFIYLNESLNLSKKVNDFANSAKSLQVIGRNIYSQGDYATALKYYFEALDIYEKNNYKDIQLGWTYRFTGSVFKRQENPEEALNYYLKALDVFLEYDNKKGIASSYNNIGIAYGMLGDRDQELAYYIKALNIATEDNDLYSSSIYLSNLGHIYFTKQEHDTALMYYGQALTIMEELNEHSAMAEFLSHMGSLYMAKGNYNKSLAHFKRALENALLSEKKQALRLEIIYQGLSELYGVMGNVESSFKYYKLYIDTQTQLHSSETAREIVELQNKHDKEKREQLIAKLEVEQELKDERLKSEENLNRSLILGLIGALLFSVVIYYQKYKIGIVYKNLVRKNIEITKSDMKLDESREIEKSPEPVAVPLPKIEEDPIEAEEKYNTSGLSDEQKEELLRVIFHEMEVNKIFKQDDLTVTKFANTIGSNRAYISQVINEGTDKNFSTFINEYRIKEARKMIVEGHHENITIEAIANSVGFKSKSAFNNSFKKFTGITPSYFMKNIEAETFVEL